MAKNKKKDNFMQLFDENFDLTKMCTERWARKGKGGGYKFKGSKKEKKVAVAGCSHNRYGGKKKNGKAKPTIINDGRGMCRCTQCGAVFPASFLTSSEINKRIDKVTEITAQARLISESVGAGRKTTNALANTEIMMRRVPGMYKNLKKVAEKKDSVKKKKKKKNDNYATVYGGWKMGR